jgi:dephospho-CoA kinase
MAPRPPNRRPPRTPRRSSAATPASRDRVAFVGLTGGLGAGKSTALETLKGLGAAVLSTDAVVHELYGSPAMREAVSARWGPQLVHDGQVDRSAVAERVFASREDREWLESKLWPLVGERVAGWRRQVMAQRPAPRLAVVEVPLLFEAGMDEAFDATIAVVADETVRAERAGGRGHTAVDERAARQLSQSEKSQRATYTVTNDGTPEQLRAQLSAIIDRLDS